MLGLRPNRHAVGRLEAVAEGFVIVTLVDLDFVVVTAGRVGPIIDRTKLVGDVCREQRHHLQPEGIAATMTDEQPELAFNAGFDLDRRRTNGGRVVTRSLPVDT